jgi:His/Glu/Gln/Arg/opine family amino acid ABC transporter permease subunit
MGLARCLFAGSVRVIAYCGRCHGNGECARITAAAYVELVRNTPLLLLIFFVYFGFGIQGLQPLGPLSSVLVAMTLNSGAYLSEVFRAGILSVSRNYVEAGQAVGLSQSQILRHVTLPLMFAQALPALTNSAVGIFKDSSLASALAVPELTFASENFAVFTFRTFEAFTASGVLYLGASLLFGVGLRRLEQRALRWT